MDTKAYATAVIARLAVRTGQPVLNQTSSFERWFDDLEAHWDDYAAKVASKPALSEWTRYGWTREKLIGDVRLQNWDAAQREDDKLTGLWAAIEGLRPLWSLRWREPLFISAVDNLVEAFFRYGGLDSHWRQILGCDDYHVDLTLFEWETYEKLFFEGAWVSYSLNASLCSFERNYVARELCYSEWQYRLRDRRYLAIYKAFATIRSAALAGAGKCPEGEAQLTAAFELPGGMFDANGDMIWFQDLSASQRTEWDNLQKTLPSTIVKSP